MALDWLLCDALGRIGREEPGAYYFRLTTRPLDQAPFQASRARLGDDALRKAVLAGAYRLVDACPTDGTSSSRDAPAVHLVASGAVVPEALAAADQLAEEGVAAHVVDVTSAGRLYRSWQHVLRAGVRRGRAPVQPEAFACFEPGIPVVTVHDAASHALGWLGSALGVRCIPLGADEFGQSGSISELYELHDLLPRSIVNAALAVLNTP